MINGEITYFLAFVALMISGFMVIKSIKNFYIPDVGVVKRNIKHFVIFMPLALVSGFTFATFSVKTPGSIFEALSRGVSDLIFLIIG
ncbi:hypothetical protein IGC24_004597 [Salmonella enterica subsp. enterica serovar Heidelberg]|uniref:hypothetical protein n=1 Tax=Salmonella enterica TaxID=28901 RepID=UPI0009A9534C|nr:hypothetical protein [Salmonella enterica]ECT1760972.1 hypothetical protein [Salmonella enterica subsp. enterica serovar Heidelberg]EED8223118.1 hypothetical protein [Salmonella enterica subsp. enterica serovar Braenderup]EEM4056888.1 hypothetical protein [Salmonella enterica subsp. enterica serovar Kentucky]EAP3229515.1 hypothetical protein [Salmonella enterica]EAR6263742.1 hypothetical protein [Salmonella enterica]